VYDNSGVLLGTTASTAVTSAAERSVTIALVANVTLAAGATYRLASNSDANIIGYKSETGIRQFKALTYGALPNLATGLSSDTTNDIISGWGTSGIQVQVYDSTTNITPYFQYDSFKLDQRVNAISTGNLRFGPLTSPLVTAGDELAMTDARLGAGIFGGYIKDLNVIFKNNTNYIQEAQCQDYSQLIANVKDGVTANYIGTSNTEKQILTALFAAYCPSITIGSEVITGSVIDVNFNNSSLQRALDDVSKAVSATTPRTWYVDVYKHLHYFAPGGESAPFALSDTPNNTSTFPYEYSPRNFLYTSSSDSTERLIIVCWQPGLVAGQSLNIYNTPLGWNPKTLQITNIVTTIKQGGTLTNPNFMFEYKLTLGTIPTPQVSTSVITPAANVTQIATAGSTGTGSIGQIIASACVMSDQTGSRLLDTVYQNLSGKVRLVMVTCYETATVCGITCKVGASNPPGTVIAQTVSYTASGQINVSDTFVIPNSYYYEVAKYTTGPAILKWIEWDIG
jgi:hypothetical protein